MVPYNGFCHSACKAPYLPHPTQLEALIVTISEAELARIVPICHPQAIVKIGVRTVATRSLPGHFNPFWDETFTFRRRAGPQPNRVSVLVVHVGRNVCHGSDGPEGAAKELAFWFKPEELVSYELAPKPWIYEKP